MIHGITCGAGMPYRLSEIAENIKFIITQLFLQCVHFALYGKEIIIKQHNYLAALFMNVLHAGGHNGLSNAEDPNAYEDPYPRC